MHAKAPKNSVDEALEQIADYVYNFEIDSEEAYKTARLCLADTMGCGIIALRFHECTKLLGSLFPGVTVPNGSRVPGTNFVLDPIQAAFNIGVMNRWLDYNDTWLAAEWGHPSDNLGGILAMADYLSQTARRENRPPLTIKDVLTFMIKAHEIQGGIALLNSFNRVGFDHVILVKVATTAVVAKMLGASKCQIIDALSNAWIDMGPLRTYRHAPNTGSRKSWAAGDATSRGVWLATIVMRGEMGYHTALSAPTWGLYDVLFQGKPFAFQRPLGSYVMENIIFKIAFPAEFHAQTAVECAFELHHYAKHRFEQIKSIEILTHESAIRIIDKKGPLNNPADRDHCIQYMVAIGLIYGTLTADHYSDDIAEREPFIDKLREKMKVIENKQFSEDYLDPEKRSIANSIQIWFHDGTSIGPVVVEYPIGHCRRRQESIPLLFDKLSDNLKTIYSDEEVDKFIALFKDEAALDAMPVDKFMDKWQRL